MGKLACDVRNLLTRDEPLGPIVQEDINDVFADELLDDQITLFRNIASDPHLLFLGRKGSGKSAMLAEMRLSTLRRGRGITAPADLPPPGIDFVLQVNSFPHFHQIVKNVYIESQGERLPAEYIPPEYFAELWKASLWEEIVNYFYEFARYEEVREILEPVDAFVNAETSWVGPATQAAERLLDAAKSAVIDFLELRQSKFYFLFDSMENYPVRSPMFSRVLSGMFPAMREISHATTRIIISFCVPEEVESFLMAGSSNLLKDFASSFRIRWKPIDLISIVAHRLRASAKIHDPLVFQAWSDLDFTNRKDLHKIFSAVLPPAVTNAHGIREDPIAYAIRHTQLLPRHILLIFNIALSEQLRRAGTLTGMTEDVLRKGVSDAQRIIADQIFAPYKLLYPKLLAQGKKILPDLEPICSYRALRQVEGRFSRLVEEDITSVWHTSYEMGVLGRSTGPKGDTHHSSANSQSFCYGQFHFNAEMDFGFATDGEYCFHPVFSRAFGMIRRNNNDSRVVYPANINLEDVYA